ncbi:hypothetical protein KCU76_g120, partial [Aureobasidium melanogenum]
MKEATKFASILNAPSKAADPREKLQNSMKQDRTNSSHKHLHNLPPTLHPKATTYPQPSRSLLPPPRPATVINASLSPSYPTSTA